MSEKTEQAVQRFIDDISILDQLSELNDDLNFFEITGIQNKETKHSNFLAWLFDKNASHQLDGEVTRRFIQKVFIHNSGSENEISKAFHDFAGLENYEVKREWKHIDLFLVSCTTQTAVAIENKIFAKESEHQLSDYKRVLEREYKCYKKVYIFLTLNGEPPSDPDNWLIADYRMIYDAIAESLKANPNIPPKAIMIIESYLLFLRRHYIMNKNDGLVKKARKIYKDYKTALDFIFESRDIIADVREYLEEWLVKNGSKHGLHYDKKFSSKGYLRFTSDFVEAEFPRTKTMDDAWKTGYRFMYELIIDGNGVDWVATISDKDDKKIKLILEHFRSIDPQFSAGSRWTYLRDRKPILTKNDFDEDNLENVIDEKMLAVVKEIKHFEEPLKNVFDK